MSATEQQRFAGLDFEGFRQLALRGDISDHERVGFPDAYREGREQAILADVASKLPALDSAFDKGAGVVVDIGCGCGPLADAVRERCAALGHKLVLIDSAEMLARSPDGPGVEKVAARFPDCADLLARRRGAAVAVLAYSVLQYAFTQPGVFEFVDAACELLAPGGRLLVGDLPNASMRRRFLASEAGEIHHRGYSGRDEKPDVRFNAPVRGEIDDAVALAVLARVRAAGQHAWIVPQAADLPMANRREDLLIARP